MAVCGEITRPQWMLTTRARGCDGSAAWWWRLTATRQISYSAIPEKGGRSQRRSGSFRQLGRWLGSTITNRKRSILSRPVHSQLPHIVPTTSIVTDKVSCGPGMSKQTMDRTKNEDVMESAQGTRLDGNIGRFQLFALGFGSIIGSAWIVILSQWLATGGPGGAILGFIAGGSVMIAIATCYAELTIRVPRAGGEYVYALQAFGRPAAFLVGWFVILAWISVAVFEGLALSRFAQMIVPNLSDHMLYRAFGRDVGLLQISMGAFACLIIAAVNYSGSASAVRFQSIITYGFIAIVLSLFAWLLVHGSAGHLAPFFPSDIKSTWYFGALNIFVGCAFFLNGFQAIAQVVEERSGQVPLRRLAGTMVLSVALAALFYCICIIAVSGAAPWRSSARSDMAIVAALNAHPFGRLLSMVVLITATASLLKSWNGVFVMLTRVIIALAREAMLPSSLAVTTNGVPRRAILIATLINLAGLFLGSGAIGAMAEMSASCIVLCFFASSLALLTLRSRDPEVGLVARSPAKRLLPLAIAGSLTMAVAAFLAPIRTGTVIPFYPLLVGWILLGSFVYRKYAMRGRITPSVT